MQFNYNTLNVTLKPQTRSIEILLNRPDHQHQINVEMLFELESLFSWLTAHLEVNAITISSTECEGHLFCAGFDREELKIMSEEKVQKYMVRLQKIVSGMLHLPQTIICDLKNGASGMGLELALGADIRFATNSAQLHFNSLQQGWVSCAGGTSLLSTLVGHGLARQWTMASKSIGQQEMTRSGLVMETYGAGESPMESTLQRILKQAPVARIQTKGSLLETIRTQFEEGQHIESSFAFAALNLEDWKKEEDFTSARDFSGSIKKRSPEPTPDLQA